MPDSPISASPYEVLGVSESVSHDDLRAAYRRLLRETHPDTGGNSDRFVAVQLAWERIGDPDDRAAYDRGHSTSGPQTSWAPTPPDRSPKPDTRPRARSYGHPGGWRRERYLDLIKEWVGRGTEIADPYDPALVRSAPRDLRHILADAIAEEATARTLADLGIGFTIWHDVATWSSEAKIDHVILGPTGLYAVLSEDFGGPVRSKRGELIGDALDGERPMHELAARAKAVTRSARVRFSGLLIVLPDDALEEPLLELGTVRGARTGAIRQSQLGYFLRSGLPGVAPVGGNELFDIRTRLAAAVTFA